MQNIHHPEHMQHIRLITPARLCSLLLGVHFVVFCDDHHAVLHVPWILAVRLRCVREPSVCLVVPVLICTVSCELLAALLDLYVRIRNEGKHGESGISATFLVALKQVVPLFPHDDLV